MGQTAWEYTLKIISIATDIDIANDTLSKTKDERQRDSLSKKIDALEYELFEIKDKLKKVNLT